MRSRAKVAGEEGLTVRILDFVASGVTAWTDGNSYLRALSFSHRRTCARPVRRRQQSPSTNPDDAPHDWSRLVPQNSPPNDPKNIDDWRMSGYALLCPVLSLAPGKIVGQVYPLRQTREIANSCHSQGHGDAGSEEHSIAQG
jgi:hypothetical protein